MKRTPLLRSVPLSRKAAGARKGARMPQTRTDAERAWKTPRWGRCENCGLIDVVPLHGHHVVARQVLARAGVDEWDEANRMDLCGTCHFNHEYGLENRKIKREKIPERARLFADRHGLAHELERRYAA